MAEQSFFQRILSTVFIPFDLCFFVCRHYRRYLIYTQTSSASPGLIPDLNILRDWFDRFSAFLLWITCRIADTFFNHKRDKKILVIHVFCSPMSFMHPNAYLFMVGIFTIYMLLTA